MPDILDLIKSRRSIRKYKTDPIPEEIITKILEAGRWAPSADNSQPWSFIVLRSPEIRKRLVEILVWGRFLQEAPLGIAVCIDPASSSHLIADGAAATENILLEAHSLRIGTCWVGVYGSEFEKDAKAALGVPEDQRLLCVIAIGYPAESRQSSRKMLNKIVFLNQYGIKF